MNHVTGVNFALWAPNATAVSIVGDFNHWDDRRPAMRKHIPSGIWELFVPGIGPGTQYKYRLRNGDQVLEKSDPYGFAAEVPPRTASVVADLNHYKWRDADWMDSRRDLQALDRPMSFYEVHLGSWRGRATIPAAGSATATWPSSSSSTCRRWATRTSSCCR